MRETGFVQKSALDLFKMIDWLTGCKRHWFKVHDNLYTHCFRSPEWLDVFWYLNLWYLQRGPAQQAGKNGRHGDTIPSSWQSCGWHAPFTNREGGVSSRNTTRYTLVFSVIYQSPVLTRCKFENCSLFYFGSASGHCSPKGSCSPQGASEAKHRGPGNIWVSVFEKVILVTLLRFFTTHQLDQLKFV